MGLVDTSVRRPPPFLAVAVALGLAASAISCSAAPRLPWSPGTADRPSSSPWFGVLQPTGDDLPREASAGISVATLELAWDRYQPAPGTSDPAYVSAQRQELARMLRAGFRVVLDAGLQYAPAWVFRDPDSFYVDQYGDRFDSAGAGQHVANGVFDPAVREAEAGYIATIARDFGDPFFAIRVGGGWNGELHYPPGDYAGRGNLYWAYDASAQAASPAPGWRPGQASTALAAAFWAWYAGSLRSYQAWQVATYRRHFSAWLEVLYPGWGLRPGQEDAAVRGLLADTTAAEVNGETQQGNDFAGAIAALDDRHAIVYTVWLDAPAAGTTTALESPADYLHGLAVRRGLPTAGENSVSGRSASSMRLSVRRTRALTMAGMMWMNEQDLVDRPGALSDYGSLIHGRPWTAPAPRP